MCWGRPFRCSLLVLCRIASVCVGLRCAPPPRYAAGKALRKAAAAMPHAKKGYMKYRCGNYNDRVLVFRNQKTLVLET